MSGKEQSERIDPKRIGAEFYDKSYFTDEHSPDKGKYGNGAFRLDNMFHKKMAMLIMDILPIKTGQKLLELGCAMGNVIHWLVQDGVDAHGIDISEYAVEHTYTPGRVKRQDVIEGLPYDDESFDYIYTRETLEHIDEYYMPNVLIEMHRVLRPCGKGLISTRNNFGCKEDDKQSNPHSADKSHLCVRTPSWWGSMLEQAGFSVDYRRTLKAMCIPICEKFTWTMLVIEKD